MMIESSRRGFIGGLLAIIAAPAIVRATNLMPIKAIDSGWRELEFAYPYLNVRPEWLTLDDYAECIMRPMIESMQRTVANVLIEGAARDDFSGIHLMAQREYCELVGRSSLNG